jgi:hypothetical protein
MRGADAFDELCDDLLARNADLERAQMLGSATHSGTGKAGTSAPARLRRAYAACLKRNGRLVACFSAGEDAMVFKLKDPAARADALALAGAHLFDPGGRGSAFEQWVVVPPALADRWPELAAAALSSTSARA